MRKIENYIYFSKISCACVSKVASKKPEDIIYKLDFCMVLLLFPFCSSLAWHLLCKVMATMNGQVPQGYLHTSFLAAFRF